jgi:transposase
MEYYVGLDVSLKQTSICVVDQTGSVVREGVVDSDPEAISVYVRSKAPDAVRIGLETDRRPPGYGPSLRSLAYR